LVLGVVAGRRVGIDHAQFDRDQRQPLGLQAPDDLADKAAFDGVGLADDEGAVHGAATLVQPRTAARAAPTTYSDPVMSTSSRRVAAARARSTATRREL